MQKSMPDFDQLVKIARNDPEQLEDIRRNHIDALIEGAPAYMQARLRGLQFQVDAQRRIQPNPTASCVKISGMMMDSLERLRCALNEPVIETRVSGEPLETTESGTAAIYEFPQDQE